MSKLQLKKYPVKLLWHEEEVENSCPVQILITVPKRTFKKAVDRNRIKRQIREIYRLNNQKLKEHLTTKNISISLCLIYVGSELPDYSLLESKIKILFSELIQQI